MFGTEENLAIQLKIGTLHVNAAKCGMIANIKAKVTVDSTPQIHINQM